MRYIKTDLADVAFHFSAEEFCMDNMDGNEAIIMFWQTDRCIMLGNNQIASAEINLDKATEYGIDIVRRPSGGGTIYTDAGTLLISIIIPFHRQQDVKAAQRKLIEDPLRLTLNQLGIAAEIKGRNDVLVNGQKISGIAQHMHNHKLCSHCSLLFDTDFSILGEVLNPDTEKMRLKGIKSVKSRVTNLKEHAQDIDSITEFKAIFIPTFLTNFKTVTERVFTSSELVAINEKAKQKYQHPEWNFGKNIAFNYHYSHRFTQGKIDLFLQIEKGYIQCCKIRGDFLNIRPIEYIEQQFQGIAYRPDAIKKITHTPDIAWYLGGINVNDFLYCFFAK